MSSLKDAASRLNLAPLQATALVDNLFLAGAFEPEALWNSLHMIGGGFGKGENIKPEPVFRHAHQVLQNAGAYDGTAHHFHAEKAKEQLFSDSGVADEEDAEDMLVYWTQSSYGRNANQERYEIPENERLRENQERYQANARALGIINTMTAGRKKYDETWVLGSVRQGMIERVDALEKSVVGGHDPGKIRILAGNWELYAEISGKYNPATDLPEGGGDYLLELAERHDIAIHPEEPFIVHDAGMEETAGRITGKTYLNYLPDERRRLTESLMARDIVTQFVRKHDLEIAVSQTNPETTSRPDTLMTVENEARRLVMQMRGIGRRLTDLHEQLHIQLVSGQPSVMRQVILTQRAINAMLVQEAMHNLTVHVHGIGRHAYHTRLEILQSEQAALIMEHYLTATLGKKRKRAVENLMFRTRDNNPQYVPVLPAAYS